MLIFYLAVVGSFAHIWRYLSWWYSMPFIRYPRNSRGTRGRVDTTP